MNKRTSIPFCKTGYFSKMMCDYLAQNTTVLDFYNNFPNIKGFKRQLELKRKTFQDTTRITLVNSLKKQYKSIKASNKTSANIALLLNENTFTVTTGHQLNLFTGPLYFLYKIISTINLAEQLKQQFPKENFVPIYWMATEDHDFEEIQYFNFRNTKIKWNRNAKGAVGRLSTQNLEFVFDEFSKLLGNSIHAKKIKKFFFSAYLQHQNLAEATRFLANELFGNYGLVILDGDDETLKRQFLPFIKDELFKNTAFKEVTKTIKSLEKNYKIQVNPREINLFYLTDKLRERIIFEDNLFKINNTSINFTTEELLYELKLHPERFSPNVIMRPLYQEVVLPNLCYIGGGGELAYWLELKNYFTKVAVPFPILLLRNSALLISEKQSKKLKKLNISVEELFLKQHELINKKVTEKSTIKIDFSAQRNLIEKHFKKLEKIAIQTDKSFIGAVNAQKTKQLKGLNNLEKRLLKAEKRMYNELVNQIITIQNELFPNNSLQERFANFSEFYLAYNDKLIEVLKNTLKPLDSVFTVIEMKE